MGTKGSEVASRRMDPPASAGEGADRPPTAPERSGPDPGGLVVGTDGISRCGWAVGSVMMTEYHDSEWGVPVHSESGLFERIVLEGFQAGLSWRTILAKRPAFRRAFVDFDPDRVAAFTDEDLEVLMVDAGIVRNRAKIVAARGNARAIVALRDRGGIDALIWGHDPGPLDPPRHQSEVPTSSPASVALVAVLKRAGIRFLGPTSAFALMEAIGVVNTHLVGCHRRAVCEALREGVAWPPS